MKFSTTYFFILTLLAVTFSVQAGRNFVHPGLTHKQSDFERMRYMIEAGIDPWKTSYLSLQADAKANYNYAVRGNSTMTVITPDGINNAAFASDVQAAYLNALMWGINGDKRHADKCVEIFNAWCNLTTFTGGGTESLNTGRVIWKLLEAAEIIKSTYSGWKTEDVDRFKAMLVYPGYSSTQVPPTLGISVGTFYWRMYMGDAGRHGNQDLFGWRGIMAMGIFLDNEIMYDRALRYLKGMPHRADDLPYQSGPPIITNTPDPSRANDYYDYFNFQSGFSNDSADYGYNGVIRHFIWENGQCQESSRDQDHAILGVGMVASLAEIAWNQGDDLWSIHDNRILKGYNFALRYNVSYKYAFDDQPQPWEPTVENGQFIQRRDRTGRWFSKKVNPYTENIYQEQVISRGGFKADKRPIYALALAHYKVRMNMSDDSLKWIYRAHQISQNENGYETNGWSLDHLGWGELTAQRPTGCAGDPCTFVDNRPVFRMNRVNTIIEAEDFDYFVGDGQGKTYYDLSVANEPGRYRSAVSVDIDTCSAGGYQVKDMQAGEWLTYTVHIPATTKYRLKINYSAIQAGAKVKFEMGGTDITGAVEVPFGAGFSTSATDFKNFTVADTVLLTAGVQALKLHISGVSGALQLNNLSVEPIQLANQQIQLKATAADASIDLTWQLSNIFPESVSIYRNSVNDLQTASLLVDKINGTSYRDNSVVNNTSYFYWIKVKDVFGNEITSDVASVISTIGLINDEFETGNDGWVANTSGASAKAENGKLVVTLAEVKAGVFRGDIKRSQGAIIHPGNYPIFAFSLAAPAVVNIHLDTNIGSYGEGSNKWTGKIGNNVYYYDLTKVGFRGDIPSSTTTTTFTLFQIKVADITSGERSYTCDWVKTFKNVEELKQFAASTAVGKTVTDESVWQVDGDRLTISGIENQSVLTVYDRMGRTVLRTTSGGDQLTVTLETGNLYLIKIQSGHTTLTKKIFL